MIIREAIEQSKQTAFREGYSQNADGKNVFESGQSVEPVNEVFNTTKSAGHLAKQLEGIFNNLVGDVKGNNQAVSDSKERQAEKEKKVALGQKDDDSESSENKKYITM